MRDYEIQCWIESIKQQNKEFLSNQEIEQFCKDYTPEVAESRLKAEPVFIYVRTDQDYFLGKGAHQAILNLGNGLVAKGPIYHGKPTILEVMERFPHILTLGYGNYAFVNETIRTLNSVFGESKIVIPHFSLYRVGWNQQKDRVIVSPDVYHTCRRDLYELLSGKIDQPFPHPNVCITKNLTEEGQFEVVNYSEEVARNLVNGTELVRDFNFAFGYLMQHYVEKDVDVNILSKAKRPYLIGKPHGFDFSPDTAIKNMFLLQVPVDKKESGRLVLGDIDHVCLFE